MRMTWLFPAFFSALLLCPAAKADSAQKPMTLDDYRTKAALPAICAQVGGTIVYGTNAHECKLPTVTTKVPSSANTASHALPVTVNH